MRESTADQRDIRQGWCPEGRSLNVAIDGFGIAAYRSVEEEFKQAHPMELRAACHLAAFTGLSPRWRDRDGRQGAIDIELHGDGGAIDIAEVTSTLHGEHERDARRVEQLVDQIGLHYTGGHTWLVHLQHGWTTPGNREMKALAVQIAQELFTFDATGRTDGAIAAVSWMFVRHGSGNEPQRVSIVSWNTNSPEAGPEPYLNRLTRYLSESQLIASKRRKLLRESNFLGSQKKHLYLHMTLAGRNGHLFPASPFHLTRGKFNAPDDLTDLWLDGGTGEIYHWQQGDDWSFHRLRDWPDEEDWLFATEP